jgi:lysophospholipase L1-like esterase
VFASVLPVHNYTPRAERFFALRPRDKIVALNRWLKEYCAVNGDVYLDYYSAMVDERGLLKRELADDGLHPNPAGYKTMAPLTSAAIARARAGSQAATLP